MPDDPRKESEKRRAETDELRLQFIRTELDSADTFLQLAEAEWGWGHREESIGILEKALKASAEAAHYIAKAQAREQDTAKLESTLRDFEAKAARFRSILTDALESSS